MRMLKRFSNNIHNAASWYEGSVLEEVTVQSLQELKIYHPLHCHLLLQDAASGQCKALLAQVGVLSAKLSVSLKASVMGHGTSSTEVLGWKKGITKEKVGM